MSEGSGMRPGGAGGWPLRIILIGLSAVVLVGIAWGAAGVGPWIGREPGTELPPIPTDLPDFTPPSLPDVDLAPPPAAIGSGWLVWVLIGLGAVLLVALVVMLFFWRRDRAGRHAVDRDDDDLVGLPAPPAAHLPFDARAAADHVIACWLWVEAGARAAGLPRGPQQTPTEFLDALRAAVPMPPGADDLLPLYHRARFDLHTLAPDSAATAQRAAEQIRGALAAITPAVVP
ncbi:DUF4129 domain-containing protein [Nakamurella sp. YIM 132087]|uniref:DUF4129 domain-containing protein n=1 Tax=Nakamurella alba TaxID=2665158 RepID=A0A7K1FJ79_9ACTN|nr:DUF4129 domain-containing protein [Nakamurella alba]MTD14177.1 DUF4129 domain-containing protein [Nakamurella alba]